MTERSNQGEPTRRAFVAGLSGAAIGLLASHASAQQASAIKRGGTFVESFNWTYPSLDPHLSSQPFMAGHEAMYNTLVRFELADPKTGEQKVVGDLAESWEQPDPKTLIFKLRQGVTFHDGSPADAEVAAWNMLRARDHPKSQWKTQLAVLESAEALNKSTLRLSLKAPSPGFVRSMGYASGARVYIVSKAAMDKLGEDGFNRAPVGTGAFRFKQWITDDRLILERNPNYFEMGADGKPLPYLDGFVGRFVPDPTVALVDMRAGAVHLVEWVATKDVAAIKADPNLVLYELPWAGQNYFKVGFNAKAAPFNDVRVRQAALMGIDRAGMAKALGFGVGVPHYYPFWLPRTLGYDETAPKNEYNPAKVKELLTAAGHPNGISIELKVIAREPENTIGEFVQQMWGAVGHQDQAGQPRAPGVDRRRARQQLPGRVLARHLPDGGRPRRAQDAHHVRRAGELGSGLRPRHRPADERGRRHAGSQEAPRELPPGPPAHPGAGVPGHRDRDAPPDGLPQGGAGARVQLPGAPRHDRPGWRSRPVHRAAAPASRPADEAGRLLVSPRRTRCDARPRRSVDPSRGKDRARGVLALAVLPEPRVQRAAKPVSQQVEGEHGDEDGDPRCDREPQRLLHVLVARP